MTAQIIRICDFHLQRAPTLEQQANKILGEVLSLEEFAKLGGPIVEGADPWAGRHYPGEGDIPA